MFQEVKESLPISGDDYDREIIRQIKACALDLTTSAEIVMPGEIAITRTWVEPVVSQITGETLTEGYWVITDTSTLKDELIITVISIWCNMRIGNPPNYEQLRTAYNSYKGQLRISKNYTHFTPAEETEQAEETEEAEA